MEISENAAAAAPDSFGQERPVAIAHGQDFLTGSLARPRSPRAVALIANDHGCARHTPPLLTLARELRRGGLATLFVDVVTPGEEALRDDLLAARIDSARAFLSTTNLRSLPLVLVGLGEAAPAALLSAAARPAGVKAVVASGRDPAAAGFALERISASALLVARAGPLHDIAPQMRALAVLGGERNLVVLNDSVDPEKHALDMARAILTFLSRPGHRAAA